MVLPGASRVDEEEMADEDGGLAITFPLSRSFHVTRVGAARQRLRAVTRDPEGGSGYRNSPRTPALEGGDWTSLRTVIGVTELSWKAG